MPTTTAAPSKGSDIFYRSLITRHGLPAAKNPCGIFRVTTLPVPITVLDPMLILGQIITPPEPNSWGHPLKSCSGIIGGRKSPRAFKQGLIAIRFILLEYRVVDFGGWE